MVKNGWDVFTVRERKTRSCKRKAESEGGDRTKKPRTNAPHTNVNPQVGIEGHVCHAQDPDEVMTLNVETQCLSELLGETLDSASFYKIFTKKFPRMIRLLSHGLFLEKQNLPKIVILLKSSLVKLSKISQGWCIKKTYRN